MTRYFDYNVKKIEKGKEERSAESGWILSFLFPHPLALVLFLVCNGRWTDFCRLSFFPSFSFFFLLRMKSEETLNLTDLHAHLGSRNHDSIHCNYYYITTTPYLLIGPLLINTSCKAGNYQCSENWVFSSDLFSICFKTITWWSFDKKFRLELDQKFKIESDKPTHGQTDKQTNRQTNSQIWIRECISKSWFLFQPCLFGPSLITPS